jgi:hypothetical protein
MQTAMAAIYKKHTFFFNIAFYQIVKEVQVLGGVCSENVVVEVRCKRACHNIFGIVNCELI